MFRSPREDVVQLVRQDAGDCPSEYLGPGIRIPHPELFLDKGPDGITIYLAERQDRAVADVSEPEGSATAEDRRIARSVATPFKGNYGQFPRFRIAPVL